MTRSLLGMHRASNPVDLGEPELIADGQGILSPRQTDVTEMLARGYSSKKIAREIGREVTTVNTHVENAMVRLNAVNRAHLVAKAFEFGILKPTQVISLIALGIALSMSTIGLRTPNRVEDPWQSRKDQSELVRPGRRVRNNSFRVARNGRGRTPDVFDLHEAA